MLRAVQATHACPPSPPQRGLNARAARCQLPGKALRVPLARVRPAQRRWAKKALPAVQTARARGYPAVQRHAEERDSAALALCSVSVLPPPPPCSLSMRGARSALLTGNAIITWPTASAPVWRTPAAGCCGGGSHPRQVRWEPERRPGRHAHVGACIRPSLLRAPRYPGSAPRAALVSVRVRPTPPRCHSAGRAIRSSGGTRT